MMRSIQRRVERLEEAAGAGVECPRCGWSAGDGENDTYELIFIDPGSPEDRKEYCEACGRQLVIVLSWGDEPS
jgi:hypothetical protein